MTAEIDHRPADRRLRHRPGAAPRLPVAVPVEAERGRADAGIESSAPDLRSLFEDAAAKLVRLNARPETFGPACRWENVQLRAPDLPTLAGAWLDRLIALGEQRLSDQRREAVVVVAVDRVAAPEEDPLTGRWTLRARVGLRPYHDSATGQPPEVRSASDRPLLVERLGNAWTLRARLAF